MNKKLWVRVGAVVLALAMVVPLAITMVQSTKKSDTEAPNEAIATYGENSIPEGIYIMQMMSAFSQAAQLVEDKEAEILTQEIDGVPVKEWIVNETKNYMAENFAIMDEFYKRDLSLTDEQNEQVKKATEEQWAAYGQSYAATGININALETTNIINMQAAAIFQDIYADFPEDEAKQHFEDNYTSVAYIPLLKISDAGEALTEEEIAEVTADADAYLERITGGEDIEDVIKDYEDKYQPEAAKQREEGMNHRVVIDNDYTYLDPEFVKLLGETPVGEAVRFENDQYIMIGVRYDINEDPTNFEKLRDRVLVEIKGDEFNETLADLAKEIKPDYNEKLLEKYNVAYFSALTGIK